METNGFTWPSIVQALAAVAYLVLAWYLSNQQSKLSKQQNQLTERQNAISEQHRKLAEQQNTLLEQQNRLAIYDKRYELNKIFIELVNDLVDIDFLDSNQTKEQLFNKSNNIISLMGSRTIARDSLFDKEFNTLFNDKIYQISKIINTIYYIKAEFESDISVSRSARPCFVKYAEQQMMILKAAKEVSEKMEKEFYLGDIQTKK